MKVICEGRWYNTGKPEYFPPPDHIAPSDAWEIFTGDASFHAYVEQFLAPILRPGDIVIIDNLASHKVAGIRQMIEATGAELRYLPPYSPDLNPIEQFFSKLKALLRKAAARTLDTLMAAIANILDAVTAQECSNYLADKGYRHQS